MKSFLPLLLIMMFRCCLYAQVPDKFNYQFAVRDAANMPVVCTTVSVRISILQGSPAGNAVFVETHSPMTNANGLATLQIGGGVPVQGSLSAIDWTAGPYFIRSETDPAGGNNYSINGTSQLLSVPYALLAKIADSLTGGVHEIDPVFGQSIAKGIQATDTAAWNHKLSVEQDSSVTNELQQLSRSNDTIFLSNGGMVKLPEVAGHVAINNDSLYITYSTGQVVNAGHVGAGGASAILPTVVTLGSNHITYTSATVQASVTQTGGEFILARGVCVSVLHDPGLDDTVFTAGSGVGSYTVACVQLAPNTTYFVKAFATNSTGSSFGNEISFTTQALTVPSVTAISVNDITNQSAQAEGDVTDDGGSAVLSRGFCWSVNPLPTLSDSFIIAGQGMDSFQADVQGLLANTTYHLRAWAVNAQGTGYSNELVFNTDTTILIAINTLAVTGISYHQAMSGGNILSNGGVPLLERGICFATHPEPDLTDLVEFDAMEPGQLGLGTYHLSMQGLSTNTTYYVRAFATNVQGTTYGNQQAFTTLNTPLVVLATTPVTNITGVSATSGGQVIDDGGATIGMVGICWSASPLPTIDDFVYNIMANPPGNMPFTAYLANLQPNTTYFVRSFAETPGANYFYGNQLSFTTSATLPLAVSTITPFNILNTSAQSGGTITSDGGLPVLDKGIHWEAESAPQSGDLSAGSGVGSFTVSITNLNPNTTYLVKAYATNIQGTVYGSTLPFTTKTLAELLTFDATFINYNAAVSGGNITNDFGHPVTARGVCWSASPNPVFPGNDFAMDGQGGLGTYTVALSNLSATTGYYARAFAVNGSGVSYGQAITFTTLTPGLASVITQGVSTIHWNSAESGGQIISDGGSPILEKGVCWGTDPSPDLSDNFTADGPGDDSYVSNLSGLNASTIYYVRAYATNSSGTAYGNEVMFTTATAPTVPVVGTTALTLISNTTAEGGGFVSMDGGEPVTARGICWSVNSNPGIGDNLTNDGSGTGSFSSLMAPLSGCTTYYVRAYATNSVGTGYGNQQTITAGTLHSVLTDPAMNVGYHSADLAGTALSGGCPIIERGICWHYAPGADISHQHTSVGPGSGNINVTVSGLLGNKTYYVRAYAIDSQGITYGEERSFTTAIPPGYYIGQAVGGGIVFYIDGSGQHGLICSESNQGMHAWGCSGTTVTTDTLAGTGSANTASILANCSDPDIAAKVCDNLVLNGFSDWYLPSLQELSYIYTNLVMNGVMLPGMDSYWSSSQELPHTAWVVRFEQNGIHETESKSTTYIYVRAIRGF